MCQPPRGGRNADKGISDGLECVSGESRGFHGAVDGTAAERKPLGRLSGREVHAKQRNQILFDKLFNPKVNEVLNSKLLNE